MPSRGARHTSVERVDLMTYVTCPTVRYHPTVVAQKAATVHEPSGGRFTVGSALRAELD